MLTSRGEMTKTSKIELDHFIFLVTLLPTKRGELHRGDDLIDVWRGMQ